MLRQRRDFRIGALDPLDDESTRGAPQHLFAAETMNVRMIPIQARRLIGGDAETILEGRVRWLDRCFEHLVLVAHRRQGQTVEVKVRGGERHRAAGARVRGNALLVCRVLVPDIRRSGMSVFNLRASAARPFRYRVNSRPICKLIPEPQDQQLTRLQPQCWRLAAVAKHITEPHRTVGLRLVVYREIHFEDAVLAAQILWLRHCRARRGARTEFVCAFAGDGHASATASERGCEEAHDPTGPVVLVSRRPEGHHIITRRNRATPVAGGGMIAGRRPT